MGLDSHIIYQPIKPVARDIEYQAQQRGTPRFLHCGRRYDGNKRFLLAVNALSILGYTERDLWLVGNETGWGTYIGVLRDTDLNAAYNSVDFVMCTSLVEGLCLPVIEAMAVGVVPIACRDLTTREELLPRTIFPEYEEVEAEPQSIARFVARLINEDGGARLAEMQERLCAHYLANWKDKVSPVGVAQAILKIYDGLK